MTTTTVSSNIDNQIVNDTTSSVQGGTTHDTESKKEIETQSTELETTESQGAEIQGTEKQGIENGSPEKQSAEKCIETPENPDPIKEDAEKSEEAPVTNEIKVNLIGDGVVELKRLDGSVSGTVFGNKTNQTEKPSAMDIAKQIANKQEVDIPVKISAAELKKRRSSVPAPTIGPIRPKMEKSKTIDEQSIKAEKDEIVIEKRAGGTWFGSKRIKQREIESSKDLAEKMSKKAETEALDCLEQAVKEAPEADPKKIARGASRDSYKNATTPDLERKEVKKMDKINEIKKRALKDEPKEENLTREEVLYFLNRLGKFQGEFLERESDAVLTQILKSNRFHKNGACIYGGSVKSIAC